MSAEWRSVRSGLILVFIGLLAWGIVEVLWGALSTQAISHLFNRDASGESWEVWGAALDRHAVVFPGFYTAAVVVLIAGCVGLIRAPGPGSASLLAVFALVGCALSLLVDGTEWVVRLVAEQSELMKGLESKPVYMLSALAAAIVSVMLALAILAIGRQAGVKVSVALVVLVLVFAGLSLIWSSILILARPRWELRIEHPWLWLLIRLIPQAGRIFLLMALSGITAGRLAAVRSSS